MIIPAKIQEGMVKRIIATLREELPDWPMVWSTLALLREHEYQDISAVWSYSAEHARRTILELNGGESVLEVWEGGNRICLSCWLNINPPGPVWNNPHRSILEQSPTFWTGPKSEKCVKGAKCTNGHRLQP